MVLRDLIESKIMPVVLLIEVFRQPERSSAPSLSSVNSFGRSGPWLLAYLTGTRFQTLTQSTSNLLVDFSLGP